MRSTTARPLMLSIDGLAFTDAYFEAVSGLTASGATVLEGLDRLAVSVNIWRGLMIWMGGMGVIVLAVAILPLLGVGGSQLFKAETPTPMKDTKLTPRIAETAKGLWLVYVAFTAACTLAYWLAGMDGFDALMHGFTQLISEQGGEIKKREYWGLRNLAYRMKKNRKGHYVLFNIEAPPAAIAELERTMRINEDVLRYLTLRVDQLEEGPSPVMQSRRSREDRPRRDRDRYERYEREPEAPPQAERAEPAAAEKAEA